jgi:hypothetical protein
MLYNFSGGLCDEAYVQKRMDRADEVDKSGENLSATLHPSGRDDMSILSIRIDLSYCKSIDRYRKSFEICVRTELIVYWASKDVGLSTRPKKTLRPPSRFIVGILIDQ